MVNPVYFRHARALMMLGLPLIGANLARITIGVTDTVMIGWYNVDALAGLVIANSMQFILFMLGSGYGIGLMGVLANALARGDDTQVRRSTRMAIWLSIAHAVLIMPLLWWSGPILLALNQPPIVAEYAQEYLRISGWGVGLMLCGLVLNNYLAAMERTQVLLWITVAGIPVNIAINWVLIFGHLGFPEMGVRGAAIASVFVLAAQLVAMLAYALWLPMARRFALMQRFWRPDWGGMWYIFRLGLPVGVTSVAETGMFASTNVMMGWLGVVPLAAHGIANQISAVAFMAHLGLSSAATIRIGNAQGRRDRQTMREVAISAIGLTLIFVTIVITIMLTMRGTLVTAYLDMSQDHASQILALAAFLVVWSAIFQLPDAVQVVALGMLRGVQDTRVPMWLAAFAYWVVGIPSSYMLAFKLDLGPGGLWAGMTLGLTVAACAMLWRFWRGLQRGVWTSPVDAR